MILIFKLVVLVKELLDAGREIIRAKTSLRCAQVVQTMVDPHCSECCTGKNRVVNKLEESRLRCRWKTVVYRRGGGLKGVPSL